MKLNFLRNVLLIGLLVSNVAFADATDAPQANDGQMEQCKVIDMYGNNLIKANMADSGPNIEGDDNAWIWVPYGQCRRVNNGDYSGVSSQIRAKLNPPGIKEAETVE